MKTPALRLLCLSVCLAILICPAGLHAAELTWDFDTTVPGPQDGNGNWNAINTNWWDGAANVAWNNSTPDSAIFGAGTAAFGGTVLLPVNTTNTVAGIKFRVLGSGNYNINGSSITTSKLRLFGNPIIDVSNGLSATLSVVLTGTGLTKDGGGTLTLNPGAPNVHLGPTYVTAGTLVIGGASANRRVIPGDLIVTNGSTARLGNTENITNNATVFLYSNATLEMNGRSETIGALLLDAATVLQAGTETLIVAGAIDARSGTVTSTLGNLDAGTLTKSTAGTVVLQTKGSTASGGGLTNTVLNDGTLVLDYLQDNSKLLDAGSLVVNGGTLLFTNGTHTESVGTIIVTNGVLTNASGTVTLQIATNGSYDVRNGEIYTVLAGSGRTLTKSTNGKIILGAANTYSGNTLVNGGSLLVNGAISSSNVVVGSGALLGGNGTIKGPVSVQSGGTLSAGTSVGQLTISNSLALLPGSITYMELNTAAGTNDLVRGMTQVNYAGQLVVTNLSGSIAGTPTFKLFDAAVYTNAFDTFSLPSLGSGRSWDTSGLAIDGTIKVVTNTAPPQIDSVSLTSDGLIITGSGGSPSSNYTVLTSTDAALPLAAWTPVATNQFGIGGEFSITNSVNPAVPQLFFIIRTP